MPINLAGLVPPPPHQGLIVKGHGVYSEKTRTLYPLKTAGTAATGPVTLVPALAGHRIFITSVMVSVYNTGDHAAGGCTILGVQDAASKYMGRVTAPPTTAASGVGANAASFLFQNTLMDENTSITTSISGTGGGAIIVYAYIPVEAI